MSQKILNLKLQHKNSDTEISCLIINGHLIIASYHNQNSPSLEAVESAVSELSIALSFEVIEATKTVQDKEELSNFDFSEMLNGAIEYCQDNVSHFQAMPIEYQYEDVLFSYDEMCLMLSDEEHISLSNQINHHIS